MSSPPVRPGAGDESIADSASFEAAIVAGAATAGTGAPPLVNYAVATTTVALAVQTVNITTLIPYKIDLAVNNYYKWSDLFLLLLDRFNLRNHINGVDNPNEANDDWIKEDIIVLMWIYNKVSHAVNLEAEFHGLT